MTIEENLTKTVGLHIRDVLRTDSSLMTLLGITLTDAKNHVFFTRPKNQVNGFANPRIVIEPKPSDADQLANTGIYQGQEIFLINIWVDDTNYDTVYNILDRIVFLFNKKHYTFTNDAGLIINFGEFVCNGKLGYKDLDKEETDKGELNISLNIGGI